MKTSHMLNYLPLKVIVTSAALLAACSPLLADNDLTDTDSMLADDVEQWKKSAEKYETTAIKIDELEQERRNLDNQLRLITRELPRMEASTNAAISLAKWQKDHAKKKSQETARKKHEEERLTMLRSLGKVMIAPAKKEGTASFEEAIKKWSDEWEAKLPEFNASIESMDKQIIAAKKADNYPQSNQISYEKGLLRSKSDKIKGLVRSIKEALSGSGGINKLRWDTQREVTSLEESIASLISMMESRSQTLEIANLDPQSRANKGVELKKRMDVIKTTINDLQNRKRKYSTLAEGVHVGSNKAGGDLFNKAMKAYVIRPQGGLIDGKWAAAATTIEGGNGQIYMIVNGVLFTMEVRPFQLREKAPVFATPIADSPVKLAFDNQSGGTMAAYCGRFRILIRARVSNSSAIDWRLVPEAFLTCMNTEALSKL